jgi:MFS transporter, Spinster family, sphingosine-1-phosphate transporter
VAGCGIPINFHITVLIMSSADTYPSSGIASEQGEVSSSSRWRSNAHISLALILGLGVVSVMDAMILSSLLTPIKREFGFADEQIGRLAAMFTLAGIIGAPIFGVLVNRFGRKRVLLLGVVIWSVASLFTGLAGGFVGLLFWRVLTGFGEAAYNSIAPSWLADLYRPKWRNLVFSLYMLKNKIGTALALALGGWIASAYDWRTAFFVAGVPGLLLAASLALGREPAIGGTELDAAATPPQARLRLNLAIFRYPAYLLHLLGLLFFFAAMSVQIWIPAYLHRSFAVSNQSASSFLAQVLLYTLPVGLIGGYLSSLLLRRFRWGFPAFLSVTSFLAAGAFFQAYTSQALEVTQFYITLAIACFGFSAGTLSTLVVEGVPAALRNDATSVSVVLTSGIAGVVGPEVVGALSDAYSLKTAVLLAPAAYFIAAIVWAVLAWFRASQKDEAV